MATEWARLEASKAAAAAAPELASQPDVASHALPKPLLALDLKEAHARHEKQASAAAAVVPQFPSPDDTSKSVNDAWRALENGRRKQQLRDQDESNGVKMILKLQ